MAVSSIVSSEYIKTKTKTKTLSLCSGSEKIKNECIVTFDEKRVKDKVRAGASNLAGMSDHGVRIDIPNFLRSNFRSLEALGFALKKKHKDLRRAVKFNDEALDLVMDMRTTDEADWVRIRPDAARRARANMPEAREGPVELSDVEISSLFE